MPRDLFNLFVCNIEKLIAWCIYAKENYYTLAKNSRNFQASVTERCPSLSTRSFWNVSAKSFKSTCEKVESLKILYFTKNSNPVIYRSLFVSYIAHIFVFIFVKGITSCFYNFRDGNQKIIKS